MTEVDFDELDKAVSKLMNPPVAQTGQSNQPPAVTSSAMSQSNVVTTPTATANAAAAPPSSATPVVSSPDMSSTVETVPMLTQPGVNEQATSTNTEIPSTLDTVLPPSSAPSDAAIVPPGTTPVRTSTPAVKRRGRFMDVVHPGSGARLDTSPPRRVGTTIMPTNPDIMPAAIHPPDTQLSTRSPNPDFEMESTNKPDVSPQLPEQPDTINQAGYALDPVSKPLDTTAQPQDTPSLPMDDRQESSDEVAANPQPETSNPLTAKAENETVPENTDTNTLIDNDAAKTQADATANDAQQSTPEVVETTPAGELDNSSISPFLPDAKVEKRPLGNPDTDPTPNTPEPKSESDTKDSNDDTLKEPPAVPPITEELPRSMPAELGTEVNAVESNSVVPDASIAEEEARILTAASIPQQYQEKLTDSHQNGSIYDTEQYHQPLAHADKKHGGWLWIIWILLVLIVGAVAASVYFYSTTPQ